MTELSLDDQLGNNSVALASVINAIGVFMLSLITNKPIHCPFAQQIIVAEDVYEGAKKCKQPIVAIINADDWYSPDWLGLVAGMLSPHYDKYDMIGIVNDMDYDPKTQRFRRALNPDFPRLHSMAMTKLVCKEFLAEGVHPWEHFGGDKIIVQNEYKKTGTLYHIRHCEIQQGSKDSCGMFYLQKWTNPNPIDKFAVGRMISKV